MIVERYSSDGSRPIVTKLFGQDSGDTGINNILEYGISSSSKKSYAGLIHSRGRLMHIMNERINLRWRISASFDSWLVALPEIITLTTVRIRKTFAPKTITTSSMEAVDVLLARCGERFYENRTGLDDR